MSSQYNSIKCHYEGHLNSPITDDEVQFMMTNDEFECTRHKHLKKYFKLKHPNLKSYKEIGTCPWRAVEHVLTFAKLKTSSYKDDTDLTYLLEAAVWNLTVHHKAYYLVDMQISDKIEKLKHIISRQQHQIAFKNKKRIERIKTNLTEKEHLLGKFYQVSDEIWIEKELTIIEYQRGRYLFPTTLVICVMDNIQARFYIQMYIDIKEYEENIPGLFDFYQGLHSFLIYIREKYGIKFFEVMKNWDAFAIGHIVSDEVDDMGFTTLRDTLLQETYNIMDHYDADKWIRLVTTQQLSKNRDQAAYLSLFFSNLCKNYGHPVLNPIDGIAKLRENSKKDINVDEKLALRTLWKFRQTYMFAFYKKRGHYPVHKIVGRISQPLLLCINDSRLPTNKEKPMIPLSDWGNIQLKKNHELALEIGEKELLKDTACAPLRTEWFIPYDPCAFKILYGQKKPRSSGDYEPRVLSRYLKGEEGELARKIGEQEKLYYNHMRDDIVQLCRKERELNVAGRVFCKQTYEMRLLQVALEKSLSDNILPFIREQTMTNTELEVTKRMDKIASTISREGNYNINLDLSNWNQLQRHDLNKWIFNELDQLHGRNNLYSDSHTWFNRCAVLLSSRLTPPKIGANGEPEEGDFCHYDQLGGFEGMRQKAWTLTTIMIIKLALDDCDLIGETMGQGDNQVIHLRLTKLQQNDPQHYIKLLVNTLDHYFSLGGLKLKTEETWFSQNLFEYSKIRFFKALRIDDSLKKLNRMIPDINEGFPSLQSLLTSASTTTENLSRNCVSPCVPFLIYSMEVGNIMRRKGLLDQNNDKIRLLVLLNIPSIFGGLPLSNLYQHCQRGCPDPLSIWVKIWQVIRNDYKEVFSILIRIAPCTIKVPMDPIRLVEDMYSLNIVSLPNFERRAREIVEEFLPHYITNPHVVKLLGASRSDLDNLCSILVTMSPYIANLAHEILRNSNEGVHLQLIGSFTNLQTINRIINESPGDQETIFQAGQLKDREAIQTLERRFDRKNHTRNSQHVIADLIEVEQCSFAIANQARELTWGFPITGITSPVPCN